MNAQVRRLFFVLVGLFVALVLMTTYWLWKAPDLEARQGNPQLIVQQLTIDRGSILASDGFSKLLAVGLTAALGIQAFIIMGGVSGLIPLTGITLPFVSYGGSSIVANFIVLGLLLMVSDHVNRDNS